MSPSLTLPRPLTTRTRRPFAPYLVVATFLLLVLPLVPGAVATPSHVSRVVAANPSDYDVRVELVDGGARIPVGSVEPGRTSTFREVPDVGDRWTFAWTSRGTTVTSTATRDELDRSGWRQAVPAQLGQRLHAAGEPPTPRS